MKHTMPTAITNDIRVSVETAYQSSQSNPSVGEFMFAYRITIENNSDSTIQLLKRHWFIVDSNGVKREVDGDGVVGQQPILEPGEVHRYISGCNLGSDIGKMFGYYTFEKQMDGEKFQATIPEFILITPAKLN
jgi:ApaG protein